MGLDIKSSGDLIAVSRVKQADAQTEATLAGLIPFDENSSLNIEDTREHNQVEKTGEIEPTDVDILDKVASGQLSQDKATPDGIAWSAAFAMNNHTATDLLNDDYRHTSKLLSYPEEPAYFTAAHRRGGASDTEGPGDYRQHIGMSIGVFSLRLGKGEFVQMTNTLVGVGKTMDDVYTETISALDTVTDLVIAFDPKADSAANVTCWCDLDNDGIFEKEVSVTNYTTGSNTLTIVAPGAGGVARNFRVSYPVEKDESGYAWVNTAEGLTVPDEFRLKAANVQIKLGALVADADPFVPGTVGQTALCEVDELTWELNWNASPGRCWRTGATAVDEATQVDLGDPLQTITLSRRVRDFLLKQNFDANTILSLYWDAVGGTIPGGGANVFKAAMSIPRMKFLTRDFQLSENKWAEAGTLVALKEAGTANPTVIVQCQNAVADYL